MSSSPRPIAIDTESYFDDECTLKLYGSEGYAKHPKCDVYMISVCDGTTSWAGHPRDFNFDALDGAHLLSHNAYHDMAIVQAKIEQGLFPKIRYAQWDCTANMSSYLCNRRSLADASAFLLGVHVSKLTRDNAKGKTWDDIVASGGALEMLNYARGDAELCYRLFAEHGHKWPEWERRLSRLTIAQGQRGVHINVERLERGILSLQRVVLAAIDRLPWVKTGRAPASPHGVAQACRDAGIPPPPVKAHDPDAAAVWEEIYAPTQPWVKALKDLRKANKTLATLETIKRRLRPDGTLPFSLKYFGAHTGRWSGDAGINFQNFNREPLFIHNDSFIDDRSVLDQLLKLFEKNPDDPTLNCVDVRGLIEPPPGEKVGATDLSQIEPRTLAWVVGDWPLLQKIREGFPIYEAHARTSPDLAWTGGDLKTENKKLYSLAKARVLGLGYGCGWEKFITVARMMAGLDITEDDEPAALSISIDQKIHHTDADGKPCAPFVLVMEDFNGKKEFRWEERADGSRIPAEQVPFKFPVYGANSKRIVANFRKGNPLITGLWAALQKALEEAADERRDLVLDLPSGRKLTYRQVRREKRKTKDKETGREYYKNVLTAEADGVRRVYYGGLLAENLIQAIARDVFAENMLRIYDAGIWPMWSVHDESVNAVVSKEQAEEARRLMATTPSWLVGCPVDSSLELSDRYKK